MEQRLYYRSFVDDQVRDMLIQHAPHPEVKRQCVIDSNASLEDVLNKAQTYVETLKTDLKIKRILRRQA